MPLVDFPGELFNCYKQQVAQNKIQHDEGQWLVLQQLQAIVEAFSKTSAHHHKPFFYRLLSKPPKKCLGLYIFGDIGRGKSMLMALFYNACPITQKRRVHFNVFMLEAHAFIHHWRQQHTSDAINALAKKIKLSATLLCLDEFHVTDIADAMLLERLFTKLYELDALIVMTSNRHPDDLYLGGLQRDQFLIFSQLIKKESTLVELVSDNDYRLNHLQATKLNYYFPLDAHANHFLQQNYYKFTHNAKIQAGILKVLGREISLSSIAGDVVFTTFNELCVQPLGPIDFVEIACKFSVLIMAEIPQLFPENRNEAKRFMLLIDVLYEHKVKLICTAEVSIEALYTEGDGAFEFKRTVSRLIEMQSNDYLQSSHSNN